MKRIAVFLILMMTVPWTAFAHDKAHHSSQHTGTAWLPKPPSIADIEVTDQDGRKLRFYADLVRGHTVAIEFIYTSCDSLCPALTGILGAVQERFDARGGEQPRFISISVDPGTDTPPVLKAYAARLGARPGWTFVTGAKADISALLKSLGESAAGREAHSETVLIGNDTAGRWTRASGLAPPETLVEAISAAAIAPGHADAARYFTNRPVMTQTGAPVRFYDDLIRGRTVLINFFYVSCADLCPEASANLARVQEHLGALAGSRVFLISITSDPENDTPPVLQAHAAEHGAGPGWTFLTGRKEDVDWITYKLGAYVEQPGDHNTFVLIGNDTTSEWTRMPVMSDPAQIAAVASGIAHASGAR